MLQPPTDNLYKFVAIFGLLILGFVQVYPWSRIYELAKDEARLRGEVNALQLECEQLQASTDPAEQAQLKVKQLQVRTMYDVQGVAIEQTGDLVRLMIIGSIIGAIMIVFGFVTWYRRVQRYQDLILAQEAQAATKRQEASQAEEIP